MAAGGRPPNAAKQLIDPANAFASPRNMHLSPAEVAGREGQLRMPSDDLIEPENTPPDSRRELTEIMREHGIEAGIRFLEDYLKKCPEGERLEALYDLLLLQTVDISANRPLEDGRAELEKVELIAGEILERVVPEVYDVVFTTYAYLLQCAMHIGPNDRLRDIVENALVVARSPDAYPIPSDFKSQQIDREFREGFFVSLAIAACAIGEVEAAKEVHALISKERWCRDRYFVDMLEPFGVTLPESMSMSKPPPDEREAK